MAYDITCAGAFPSHPATTLRLYVRRDKVSGNSSSYAWQLLVDNSSGWAYDPQPWWVTVGSQNFSGATPIPGSGTFSMGSGTTGWFGHDGNGNLTIRVAAEMHAESPFGNVVIECYFATDRILQVPSAPATPVYVSKTTTSVTYSFAAPNNGGSSITTFNHQAATNSAFTTGVKNWNDGSTPTTVTGLTPGTKYYFRTRAVNGVGAGPWSGTLSVTLAFALPDAPTNLVASAVAPDGFTVKYTRGATNGSPLISTDQVQYSTSSQFSGATTVTATGTAVLTGLTPGTTYYVRARSQTEAGYGPWSSTLTQATLPAGPPTITVTAAVDGKSAVVTLGAPGGVTGVTSYTIERRKTGTTTPVTTSSTTTTTYTATGLTPGTQYDWRAAAKIGAYTSPYTAWLTVIQPAPNTTPGDYFDGATPDTADVDYGWTGTANKSTSTATGKAVDGWMTFAQGVNGAGGSGVVARVTGGRQGGFMARTTFFADTTKAGHCFGIANSGAGRAEVVDGATYVGSIWVRLPKRTQSLAARIGWYSDAGVFLFADVGTAQEVAVNTWTRLTVTGTAPAPDGGYASVQVIDVAGTGWSVWVGGDVVEADEAMLTLANLFDYFDGDTPATPEFAYEWLGTANASASMRTTLAQSEINPLLDPDCPPMPAPPRPPVIDDDCIDEVGLWRRYWVTIPATEVTKWLAVIPTIRVTTGPDEARQVRIRMYPNPDALVPEAMPQEAWTSEQIVSYLPAHTEMILDGVTRRAWATVEGYPALDADHLLYGTGGTPATWPLLNCGVGYLIAFDVPVDAVAGNLSAEVGLTLRMG